MEYDEERKIRTEERQRAIKIIQEYHDGSEGAFMNMREGISEGWKARTPKKYHLIVGEMSGTIAGEANPVFQERNVDVYYASDIENNNQEEPIKYAVIGLCKDGTYRGSNNLIFNTRLEAETAAGIEGTQMEAENVKEFIIAEIQNER